MSSAPQIKGRTKAQGSERHIKGACLEERRKRSSVPPLSPQIVWSIVRSPLGPLLPSARLFTVFIHACSCFNPSSCALVLLIIHLRVSVEHYGSIMRDFSNGMKNEVLTPEVCFTHALFRCMETSEKVSLCEKCCFRRARSVLISPNGTIQNHLA